MSLPICPCEINACPPLGYYAACNGMLEPLMTAHQMPKVGFTEVTVSCNYVISCQIVIERRVT